MRFAAVVLLSILPSLASAQPPGITPPIEPVVELQPITEAPPIKNPGTATALALGGTLVGWVMILSAREGNEGLALAGLAVATIGPSAGHFYAGETGHALGTSLLRTAAVGAFFAGLVSLFEESECDFEDVCKDDSGKAAALLWGGLISFSVLTAYDLMDAGAAARRTNNRHQRTLMFTPTLLPTHAGPVPAVSLTGRF
jgi:hypothetical protein